MFCVYCGKEIGDDQIFCPFCGKKVEFEETGETKKINDTVETASEEKGSLSEETNDSQPNTEDSVPAAKTPEEKPNKSKLLILIAVGAVVIIAAIAAFVLLGGDRGEEQGPEPGKSEADSTEVVQEETTTEQSAVHEDVTGSIPVHSWDLDFSNSEHKNSDGTISYDSVMLVTNNTGRPITGIAYTVKNEYGETVENKDNRCRSEAPFYAEGYIPDGETGVMVSKITVTEEEYEKENPKYDSGHRLKPKNVSLVEAYDFRGDEGYHQATGTIDGPYKGDFEECYSAEITNQNDTPIHKGAAIIAVKKDANDNLRINVSSAKGKVDREITGGSEGVAIDNAFEDPGLKEWPANQYDVCVIDNEYSDGSHYYDTYREKYFK